MNEVVGALCFGEAIPTVFDIKNVPELILYSHLPGAIIATLLAILLLVRDWRSKSNIVLALSLLFFAYWVYANVLIWGTNRSDIIMFHWSLQVLFEPLVYIGMFYLLWLYSSGDRISFRMSPLIIGVLYLPLVLATPTHYSLSGFNLADCIPNEGFFAYAYTYFLEILSIIGIIVLIVLNYCRGSNQEQKREFLYLGVGILSFLMPFGSGNVFGSYTGEWVKSQFGLFGMPVFAVVLTYIIVRFQAFNIRLLSVQALVLALIVSVSSQLFFIKSPVNFALTMFTVLLVCGIGYLLIRSVKKEIKRKEELQIISDRLVTANTELRRLDDAKSEFISIASHQLRTPLTAIKGFVSLLLEGAYGKVEPTVADTLNKVYLANARLMNLVENLLNISRIEAGRIQYQFTPTILEDILVEIKDTFVLAAHEKKLDLILDLPAEKLPPIPMDGAKIREVVSNIIDNAVKYTEVGSIVVGAERVGEHVMITVTDTGVGIDPEDAPHLFNKFERGKDAAQVNVSSTGLGLYVGKRFVEAHGGTIRVESAGHGKGARFIVLLPMKRDAARADVRLEKGA